MTYRCETKVHATLGCNPSIEEKKGREALRLKATGGKGANSTQTKQMKRDGGFCQMSVASTGRGEKAILRDGMPGKK